MANGNMANGKPRKRGFIYALIALGFAGLIGAHEVATMAPSPADDPRAALPFILAVIGTFCFVAAGLLARKLMKEGAPK
jgi:hypothetical protein